MPTLRACRRSSVPLAWGVGARAGWVWDRFGSRFTVSGDGLVATMGAGLANPLDSEDEDYNEDFDGELMQAVTCEQPMAEGRHYWEVEVTTFNPDYLTEVLYYGALFGAVRPGQDCDDTGEVPAGSTAHFEIVWTTDSVCLFGNGKAGAADYPGSDGDVSHFDKGEEHGLKQGDRIGCLLDLDAGWLRFFRNGVRLRQEYASGVTGPLLRSAEVSGDGEGVALTALPGAETPAGQ